MSVQVGSGEKKVRTHYFDDKPKRVTSKVHWIGCSTIKQFIADIGSTFPPAGQGASRKFGFVTKCDRLRTLLAH